MALGNAGQNNYNRGSGYNNQNNNSMWEPSYYSRLRIKNADNLAITFTFWKGTLKVCISENGSAQEGRNNELAFIHLSPSKARLMSEGVKSIINSVEDQSFGVDTGVGEVHGFIAIGRKMGVPYLFIGKVNTNGQFESGQNFVFNTNYNYLYKVHNFNSSATSMDKNNLEKMFDDNLELEQFYDVLVDYARSASGALGASFYDIGRYEAAKTSNLIRKIAEKNGISVPGGENRGTNSFFSGIGTASGNDNQNNSVNPGPVNMTSRKYSNMSNIDDLESELE